MRDRFRKILVNTLLEGIINIAVICLIAVACARIEDETGYDLLAHRPGRQPQSSQMVLQIDCFRLVTVTPLSR